MALNDQVLAIRGKCDSFWNGTDGQSRHFFKTLAAASQDFQSAVIAVMGIVCGQIRAIHDNRGQQLSVGTHFERFGGNLDRVARSDLRFQYQP